MKKTANLPLAMSWGYVSDDHNERTFIPSCLCVSHCSGYATVSILPALFVLRHLSHQVIIL